MSPSDLPRTHAEDAAQLALAGLRPPDRSFASDNTAGAHPAVIEAMVRANEGHTPAYGDDPWSARCTGLFAEAFGQPVEVALTHTGTGANVVALHTLCTTDSVVVCTADAHMLLDEAGAPEHITGAQFVGYPWDHDGKLVPAHVHDAAQRLERVHIHDVAERSHVVSVTQATEVGTVYSVAELTAVCEEAHRHDMTVHLDGARLANALAHWGFDASSFAKACQQVSDCGVDVVGFGGTKAGLLGAEAVVFLDPEIASAMAQRRKQATQTASKMRFLAAQFIAAIEDGAILQWAADANRAARDLADRLVAVPGVALAYPVDSNAVLCTVPHAAIPALEAWTDFYVWDRPRGLIRFVTSWDSTDDDITALAEGVRAACGAVSQTPPDAQESPDAPPAVS